MSQDARHFRTIANSLNNLTASTASFRSGLTAARIKLALFSASMVALQEGKAARQCDRNACCRCRGTIPPGRPGRQCAACRAAK